jgi:hypothetical protein
MALIQTPDQSLFQTVNIPARGGLLLSSNTMDTLKKPGFALRLVNFEPADTGGYRRINGYAPWKGGVTPGTGEMRGVFVFNEGLLLCRGTDIFYSIDGTEWVIVSKEVTAVDSVTLAATPSFLLTGTGRYSMDIFSTGTITFALLVADGQSPFYVEIIGATIATALFTSKTIDIVDEPLKGSNVVGKFKSQSFMGGMDKFPTQVFLSNPLDATDFISANSGTVDFSDTVVGIKPFRDNIYVFCKDSIHKIVSPENPANRGVVLLTSDIGCVAGESIQEVGGDLVFLAHDGLRTLAGTTKIDDTDLSSISNNINGNLRSLYLKNIQNFEVSSVVIRESSQYRIFFRDAGNRTRGFIMYFDDKGLAYGEMDYMDVKNISSGLLSNSSATFSTSEDRVYEFNVGDDFDTKLIQYQWATPFFDLGDSSIRKTMHKLESYLKYEGTSDHSISMLYEYGDPNIPQPPSYASEASFKPAEYGSGIYATDKYASFAPQATTYLEGSAKTISIRLFGEGGSPFTIHGYDLTYNPGGTV